MISISKIILENFQSHKYSEIEFVDGLNAIIGSTDSGKTAIFRAIKWALFNEPQGISFIREGEDFVSVKIHFNSGVIVNRYRKKSKNGYELTYPDGTVTVFEGFGLKVPEEVLEATKIRKVNFTPSQDRSLNMADQLEAPFLISETPSLKAAAIGKLVEADVVDYALSETNRDLSRKREALKKSKEKLESIEEELKEFEYLDELEITIEKLEKIQDIKRDKENKLEHLERIKNSYFQILYNKNQLEELVLILQKAEQGEKYYFELEKNLNKLDNLIRLSKNLDEAKNRTEKLSTLLKDLKSAEVLEGIIPKIELSSKQLSVLEEIYKKLNEVKLRKSRGEYIFARLKDLDIISEKEEKLRDYVSKFNTLVKYSEDIKKLEGRFEKGEEYINKFEKIELVDAFSIELENKVLNLEKLQRLSTTINNLQKSILKEENEVSIKSKKILEITEKYKAYLLEEKRCPTCFKPIDIEDAQDIISHLIE